MALRPAVIIEDDILETETIIPETAGDLAGFRAWAFSESFPERGRIDFLQGTIEVNMSPEDLQTHGEPKTELIAYIHGIVKGANLGQVFTDRSRLTHPAVGLSCEPDIVYVSFEALGSGRVRYVSASERTGKLIEIEGSATLVVEIVSDSSVNKDSSRLPPLYARAGVDELWVLDARGADIHFEIRHRTGQEWMPSHVDEAGFQESRVLGRFLRMRREPGSHPGTWRYFVDEEA